MDKIKDSELRMRGRLLGTRHILYGKKTTQLFSSTGCDCLTTHCDITPRLAAIQL